MKGSAALLIPGNMCDARMWRGDGDSIGTGLARRLGRPACDADTTRDATLAGMAHRALAAVDGPVLAVGFSMGAIVAVEMALIAPERVAGLVLCGYNAGGDLPERAAARPHQQARAMTGELASVLSDELKPQYLADCNRADRRLLATIQAMGTELGPEVFVAQSEALRTRPDRIAHLGRLCCPVLYLAGAEDRLCPPGWHRRWATLTPDARCEVLAGAGHMAPLEQPAAFAGALDRWFDDIEERMAA